MTFAAATSVGARVVASEEVPSGLLASTLEGSSLALAPQRLRAAARDRRWTSSFVIGELDGRNVGLLALHQSRPERVADESYDPIRVASSIAPNCDDARRLLLIGGRRDLVSGALVAHDLPDRTASELRRAMIQLAGVEAARLGLVGIALYVRERELEDFIAGLGPDARSAPLAEEAILPVAGSTADDYLAWLPSSRRSIVRRDWRRLRALGLRATETDWDAVIEEAAPLIAAVKHKHGLSDHPRLVAARMGEWTAVADVDRVAFAVRDSDGALLAASFGLHAGDVIELYEIGLAPESAVRGLAYTEVLVYAPLRYAMRRYCKSIRLGLGSLVPKTLRGARVSPVWAVSSR